MYSERLDGDDVFVIHDLLSADECAALIARSETLGYETAAVGGEMMIRWRNNGRSLLTDARLADDLWQRAERFFPSLRSDAPPIGLHHQFRFYRYRVAEQFGMHSDGAVRRNQDERSQMTFMIYLSDVEQGGETNFYLPGGGFHFAVRPECGKALVFDHQILHEGAAVATGTKYVLRTDVLYRFPTNGSPSGGAAKALS